MEIWGGWMSMVMLYSCMPGQVMHAALYTTIQPRQHVPLKYIISIIRAEWNT